jgi:carboxylesterase
MVLLSQHWRFDLGRSMGLVPGAEPFSRPGGTTGVLLCHGFTGSPQSLRSWAAFLADAGLTVSLPLLPGHGTSWQEMNRTSSDDWYAAAEEALGALRAQCDEVFVMGLSMGACLALRLAETHAAASPEGPGVGGLVLVNPSLAPDTKLFLVAPVLKYLVRSMPAIGSDIKKPGAVELSYDRVPARAAATLPRLWRRTAQDLPRITAPVLVYRSRVDHVVGPPSMRVLEAGLRPGLLTVRACHDSYHVATMDNDAQAIFTGSLQFVREHGAVPEHGGGRGEART